MTNVLTCLPAFGGRNVLRQCIGERMWCIQSGYIQYWAIVTRRRPLAKAYLYANEVESYDMNISLSKDVKTNWKQLKDIVLKVGHQYFSIRIGGH